MSTNRKLRVVIDGISVITTPKYLVDPDLHRTYEHLLETRAAAACSASNIPTGVVWRLNGKNIQMEIL